MTLLSGSTELTPNLNERTTVIQQLVTELAVTHDELRSIIQILSDCSDAILITSPDARIVFVNPAWVKLTGYSFSEVEGKNPRLLQSGKTPHHVYKAMWQALKKNQSFTTEETIDKRKDGTEFQIRSSIFPVLKDGTVMYYVQILQDITNRKRLEEMQERFLSAAAHELKTPITVLKLLSQTRLAKAKKAHVTGNDLKELELMSSEIDRITTLVNDLLDSTRIKMGKLALHYENFDLIRLIHDNVQKMQIFADDHRIEMNIAPQELFVYADPNRIEQVLINLISNAIKYSRGKTTINISAHPKKKQVIISVEDEGVGIPKKNQKRIFDLYFQIDNTCQSSRSGFGLGLYLSKEIIKRHKGKIWVESEEGKGSKFFFSLPLITERTVLCHA